jgi:hypothetical protein
MDTFVLARCYVLHEEKRPRLAVPVHREFLSLRYQLIESDGKVRDPPFPNVPARVCGLRCPSCLGQES